jgi:hypothetical protein
VNSESYSEDERREAVKLYLTLGSFEKASEGSGIPVGTIASWKSKDRPWWDRVCAELVVEIEGNYRPGYVRVLGRAIEVMEDRLEHGDPKLTKDGVVRVGVSAKEAAVIAGIASDKLKQFAQVPVSPETQEARRRRLKLVAGEPATVSELKPAEAK